jgi:hypothetical protein
MTSNMDLQGLGISGLEAQPEGSMNRPEILADVALQDAGVMLNSNMPSQNAEAISSSGVVTNESDAGIGSTASFSWVTDNGPKPEDDEDDIRDYTEGEDEVVNDFVTAEDGDDDEDEAWSDEEGDFDDEEGDPADDADLKKSGITLEYLKTPAKPKFTPRQEIRQMEDKVVEEALEEMERERGVEVLEEDSKVTPEELAATGIQPEDATLIAYLEGNEDDVDRVAAYNVKRRRHGKSEQTSTLILRKRRDFFGSLSQYPELFFELAKQLQVDDFVSLFAISKDFHETINGHLAHVIKTCAAYRAPESSRIFVFNLYSPLCIPDPVGRPNQQDPSVPRFVPSLQWLRMVVYRERTVRDILACLAREGHRTPKAMSLTLKKMWLTMDIATSARRVQFMHNEKYWTDNDLFNVQLFIGKLDMMFNDPFAGPGDDGLRKLMLGQKGLGPLCRLLKREQYTDVLEILEAAVRYSYTPKEEHRRFSIFGIRPSEVGRGHLEGWGLGRVHLYRPDELVMRESCRRNLKLDKHILNMMCWGYVDKKTGENIKVTDEEMYMSDDEDLMRRYEKEAKQRQDADLAPPELLLTSDEGSMQMNRKNDSSKGKEKDDTKEENDMEGDVDMGDIDDEEDEEWQIDDEDV